MIQTSDRPGGYTNLSIDQYIDRLTMEGTSLSIIREEVR